MLIEYSNYELAVFWKSVFLIVNDDFDKQFFFSTASVTNWKQFILKDNSNSELMVIGFSLVTK